MKHPFFLAIFCFILSLTGCYQTSDNPTSKGNVVKIAFAGDTMLGRLVNEAIKKNGYQYPWGDTLPLLKTADFRIANLETTFTTSKKREPKVFNFKSNPDNVQALLEAQINLVSLANNHIKDFGNEGLITTIETLDKASILHAGAGENITQAQKPVIFTKQNIKIGIIGATDNEPNWQAAEDQPGINYFSLQKPEPLLRDIAALKKEVDIVIVSLHWGPNMRQRPTKEYIDVAHKIIDAGADIIHGHSAHIFQGIERYRNGLIMYDTGDFVDDYRVDPVLRNDQALLFFVSVDKTGIKKSTVSPLLISNMQVNLAPKHEKSAILKKMHALSEELGTTISDNGTVTI